MKHIIESVFELMSVLFLFHSSLCIQGLMIVILAGLLKIIIKAFYLH